MEAHPSINLPITLPLWPSGRVPGKSDADGPFPRLTYYLPSEEYRTGQSVLILPGGGYGLVSSAKEGHRPAQWLVAHGTAAAVLEYRHAPSRFPIPLLDAQRALRVIRQRANDHGLGAGQVGVLGFSAGAHLAGLLATQPAHPESLVDDPLDEIDVRPDFAALLYPVVSLVADYAHGGSRNNLLGKDSSHETAASLSLENAVSASTPPLFIVHEQNDPTTASAGALALYAALTRAGVAAGLHIYEGNRHGFGLAANHPWGQTFLQWLEKRREDAIG